MKQYNAKDIINVAITGHGGSGKTTLTESMIYLSKYTDRLGKVTEGNTVTDFDSEEIKRKVSISAAVAPIEWKNHKINIIDTPGLFDFASGLYEGIRAADSLIITLSGKSGIQVGTEKAVNAANKYGLTKIFFVSGLTEEGSRFYDVFDNLKKSFGNLVCPVVVPHFVNGNIDCYVNLLQSKAYSYKGGKVEEVEIPQMEIMDDLRTAIYEAVAETSEEMFEKYFAGEKFTEEEIIHGLNVGVKEGTVSPVFCGDAFTNSGIEMFLDGIVSLAPVSNDKKPEEATDEDGNIVEVKVDENDKTAAIVFKTTSDPFIGKLSYFKVVSGKVSPESTLVNMRTGEHERISKVAIIRGKKQEEAKEIVAGDIGVAPKLQHTNTSDTLCSPERKITLKPVEYPNSMLKMAIYPLKTGDEDKVAQGILRICEEDFALTFKNNSETHEMLISGLGEQHLDVVVTRLKNRFSVDAELKQPKIAYREAIKSKVKVQGKHKKQTGGHGQFGDVHIEFEPGTEDDLEFCETIVGGAVPKGYFPAVEKGLRESIKKGPLAGYPVVKLKATLYDGSYHTVDSSEMAFKMAAMIAYREGLKNAKTILLEPIGNLKVIIPEANMGDVLGEINKRRGRVLGMNPNDDNMQVVEAEVPEAEMSDFSTLIRQISQGRGSYIFEFVRYEEVPGNIAEDIIEKAKNND